MAELSAYTTNVFYRPDQLLSCRAFADEPQVQSWARYVEEATVQGVLPVLQRYLVPFNFPVRNGISQTAAYRNASLRGQPVANMPEASGLEIDEPEKLQLYLHQSLAGKIPVLVAANRHDFQALVRALSYRNEPVPLPDAMGAAMVRGFNNWHRLRQWQQKQAAAALVPPGTLPDRALYQDRLIVLSRIPYSNVPATELQLAQEDWLDTSLRIRLEHECAHYFTLRYFGKMTNHMHDELIADYLGITAATGQYRADWFLRFIGLENYPLLRPDGRLFHYLGQPPLSAPARAVLCSMLKRAAEQLEQFERQAGPARNDTDRQCRLLALCRLDLSELASGPGAELLYQAYNHLQVQA